MSNRNIIEEYRDYLKIRKGSSYRTIKDYTSSLHVFIRFKFKEDKDELFLSEVKQIKVEDILNYKKYLTDSGKSSSTVRTRFDALLSFISFLQKQYSGFLEHMEEIKDIKSQIKVLHKKKTVLTIEEGLKVLEYLKHNSDNGFRERNYLLFVLFLSNGLRLSETINLKEEDIDIDKETIYFNGETTKGNVRAELPLNDKAIEAYKEYLSWKRRSKYKDNEYVFVSRKLSSEHLKDTQIQRLVNQIIKDAGINKKLSPHCFRATFATLLNDSGASPFEIQAQMRHASITTTGIYININNKRMRETNNLNPLFA